MKSSVDVAIENKTFNPSPCSFAELNEIDAIVQTKNLEYKKKFMSIKFTCERSVTSQGALKSILKNSCTEKSQNF